MRFWLILIFAYCVAQGAKAQQEERGGPIHLPEEELARESVLPYVTDAVSVKSRNVVTEQKFEFDLGYGSALSEPVYSVGRILLGAYYHLSELHAFGIWMATNSTGLSNYANQLNREQSLDLSRAPQPQKAYFLEYDIKPYYGKMSLTKGSVFNLGIFGSLGVGMIQYAHKSYFALGLGVGQKFYFNSRLALRADLRLVNHQAPVPFLPGYIRTTDPVPTHSQFSERNTFTTNLDIGLSYLL